MFWTNSCRGATRQPHRGGASVFNTHGNRKNKNKARLKFVVRERGWEWVKEEIEKNYQTSWPNGGIATPETVPDGFVVFNQYTTTWNGAELLQSWDRTAIPSRPTSGGSKPIFASKAERLCDGDREGAARQLDRPADAWTCARCQKRRRWAVASDGGSKPGAGLHTLRALLRFTAHWIKLAGGGRGAPDRGRDYLSRGLQLQPCPDEIHEPGRGFGWRGEGSFRSAGSRLSIKISGCPNPCASTGSATSASTAMLARSTARKFHIT